MRPTDFSGRGTETTGNVADRDIRAQLDRILRSRAFRNSERLQRFLKFAVECALDGTLDRLKESLLGRVVFDRGSKYDPRTDSIVRVESQRLRKKLITKSRASRSGVYHLQGGKLRPDICLILLPSLIAVARRGVGRPFNRSAGSGSPPPETVQEMQVATGTVPRSASHCRRMHLAEPAPVCEPRHVFGQGKTAWYRWPARLDSIEIL